MCKNKEWEEKYQTCQRRRRELEEKQKNNRDRSHILERDEETYWEIRRQTRQIYSNLSACWKSPEYYRWLNTEEEDMQEALKKIETTLEETQEYLEKEKHQLLKEEREYEDELRKLNAERKEL